MDVCLLAKWLWGLDQENGLWQQIVKAKYLHFKSIHIVTLEQMTCVSGMILKSKSYISKREQLISKQNVGLMHSCMTNLVCYCSCFIYSV